MLIKRKKYIKVVALEKKAELLISLNAFQPLAYFVMCFKEKASAVTWVKEKIK